MTSLRNNFKKSTSSPELLKRDEEPVYVLERGLSEPNLALPDRDALQKELAKIKEAHIRTCLIEAEHAAQRVFHDGLSGKLREYACRTQPNKLFDKQSVDRCLERANRQGQRLARPLQVAKIIENQEYPERIQDEINEKMHVYCKEKNIPPSLYGNLFSPPATSTRSEQTSEFTAEQLEDRATKINYSF